MEPTQEAQVDHVVGTQEPSQVWPPHESQQASEDARDSIRSGTAKTTSEIIDKLDARGLGIRITNCGACDGTHEDMKVNEYARPLGPFTHWFMCPTLHDPVNLTLGMLKTGEGLELSGPVCRELAKAQIAGRYMVFVCYVTEGDGKTTVTLTRHGNKFPTDKIYPSKENRGLVGLLMDNLKDEFGDPQPVEMKQVAPHPLKSLMGRVEEAIHPMPPQ